MILELALAERNAARRARLGPAAPAPALTERSDLAPGMGSRWVPVALLLALTLLGCGSDLPHASACGCPAVMDPVCGLDGRTYPSACALDCARVAFDHWGHCGRDAVDGDRCDCPRLYDPVCGLDGVSYLNDCARTCAGAPLSHAALCDDVAWPCGCSTSWAPACGGNGVTYPNPCVLACMDVALDHSGECP